MLLTPNEVEGSIIEGPVLSEAEGGETVGYLRKHGVVYQFEIKLGLGSQRPIDKQVLHML